MGVEMSTENTPSTHTPFMFKRLVEEVEFSKDTGSHELQNKTEEPADWSWREKLSQDRNWPVVSTDRGREAMMRNPLMALSRVVKSPTWDSLVDLTDSVLGFVNNTGFG